MLTYDDIVSFHDNIINQIGGAENLRDHTLLLSAIGRAETAKSYGQSYISTLTAGIVSNHPFVDGNKRTAAAVLLYYMYKEGYTYDISGMFLASLIHKLTGNLSIDSFDDIIMESITPTDIPSKLTFFDFMNEDDLLKSTLDVLFRYDLNQLTEEENSYFVG